MKVSDTLVKELAGKLAELIAAEMESKHAAAILMHESDVLMFLKVMDIIDHKNPLQGNALHAVRKAMHEMWDNSKVLSGSHMDFLERALDLAQQQDEWRENSAKHELANAY